MVLNQLKVHASAMHCIIPASGSGLQILVLQDFASAAPPDTSSRVIIESRNSTTMSVVPVEFT